MILVTGFPGFLGSHLVSHLVELTSPEIQIICLVQEKFVALAKQKISQNLHWKNKVQIIVGDITSNNLGLTKEWNERVQQIYHLAAAYDLSVKSIFAQKINIEGTRNVLQFASACSHLKRLDYVSTCYVSGRFLGHFFETDLSKGQTFNNSYEETKFLAELKVQEAMQRGLPIAIYRPGIIVGDSKTGATQKFDGPYSVLQWIDRQKPICILPELGDYRQLKVNLVPIDFVSEAIAKLSVHSLSLGKVYHLTDPNPPTIREFLNITETILNKKIITFPFLPSMTKKCLQKIKPLRQWMKINPDTIDYFTHPTIYDSTNASLDLSYLEVKCPNIADYLPSIIAYMKSVEEHPSEAMI